MELTSVIRSVQVEPEVPIPPNEMAGVIVVNAFAITSTLALVAIFLRVSYLGVRRLLGEDVAQSFFNTQLGYYAACLLIANLVNAIAGLMGLPFLVKHAIVDNALCTFQASVMQFGNIATAYFTVAIAFHTFNSLVLRKRQSIYVYGPTILVGWVLSAVLAFLPLRMGAIYGPSGLACGVRPTLLLASFYLHLLPIFVAAVLSAILYSLVFLVLHGIIVFGAGGVRFSFNSRKRSSDQYYSNYQRFVASIARSMLWYPAAYILLLVPYSVTRLLEIQGAVVPFQAVVFAFVCWFALGIVDALLLFNTYRILGPAFEARSSTDNQPSDLESFGTEKMFKFSSDSTDPLQLNLTDAMIKEYRGGAASISSKSSHHPSTMVSYPESVAPMQSRSRPNDELDQQITPVSLLNESIVVDASRSSPTHVSRRTPSNASDTSLPVPPRRTPTPSPLIIVDSPFSAAISPISRPAPTQPSLSPRNIVSASASSSPTRMHPVMPRDEKMRLSGTSRASSNSGDLDITGWLGKQNEDGSMRSGLRNQPMLSAVKPNFPPTPTASINSSDPAMSAAAAARLRPLLLASVERTGSMVLAEQYNRLYVKSPNGSLQSFSEENF